MKIPEGTNITVENSKPQVVKFYFETSNGPGHVTLAMATDEDIDGVKEYLLATLKGTYTEILIVDYEVLKRK